MLEVLMQCGLISVFGLSAAERIVPLIPSYMLFSWVGVLAAQSGDIVFHLLAAILGSVLGGLATYGIGYLVPTRMTRRFAFRFSWVFGTTPHKVRIWLGKIKKHGPMIVGTTQMIPTIRLLTPLLAGLTRMDVRAIMSALVIGTIGWVSLLVVATWAISLAAPQYNPLEVTIGVTLLLLAGEALLGFFYYIRKRLKPQQA